MQGPSPRPPAESWSPGVSTGGDLLPGPIPVRPAFREDLPDPARVRGLLEAHYRQPLGEEIHEVQVRIQLEGDGVLRLTSLSPHLFMLPWQVDRPGERHRTYNPRISTAPAGLLPWTFTTNREVVSGDLAFWIGWRLVAGEAPVPPRWQRKP